MYYIHPYNSKKKKESSEEESSEEESEEESEEAEEDEKEKSAKGKEKKGKKETKKKPPKVTLSSFAVRSDPCYCHTANLTRQVVQCAALSR